MSKELRTKKNHVFLSFLVFIDQNAWDTLEILNFFLVLENYFQSLAFPFLQNLYNCENEPKKMNKMRIKYIKKEPSKLKKTFLPLVIKKV